MKITSILTYTAATSLTAFLVSLIVTQDATISCAILATTMATLITLHDYSPRKYFVVTSTATRATSSNKSASAFSTYIGATRRMSSKRGVTRLA